MTTGMNNMTPRNRYALVEETENKGCLCQYSGTSVHERLGSRTPREWNALPLSLQTIESLNTFKKDLKYHLLSTSGYGALCIIQGVRIQCEGE